MRVVFWTVVVLLASVVPAAAAPWSDPKPIPGAEDSLPVLALGSSGPRAVYWQQSLIPTNPATFRPATFVSVLGPDLMPQAATEASDGFGVTAIGSMPVVDDAGVVVLPGQRERTVNWVARGRLTRPGYQRSFAARVRSAAANAAGDQAVLVDPCRKGGCRPGSPVLYVHRHGRVGFARGVVLDRRGRGYGAALAIDARGRVLVAWDRDDRVFARRVSAHGRLGRRQLLGYERAPASFSVTIAPDGRAAVAWTTQQYSEGNAQSGWRARVSIAAPGGRLPRGHVLERIAITGTGGFVPYGGVVVRFVAGRAGLVAWTGAQDGRFVVRAAAIESTLVGTPATISDTAINTVLADAALSPSGAAIVLLLPGRRGADAATPAGPDGLTAAVRPASASGFGAAERIIGGPAYIDGAYLAFDAATGAAFATWRQVGAPIGWSVREPF